MNNECGWPVWPNVGGICRRPYTREDGWGFRACAGHFKIGELNKNRGEGMSEDVYVQKYRDAIQWLKDNPNPPEESGETKS